MTESICLLVGRWDRMPASPGGGTLAEDGLANWQDLGNVWVTINAQTGLVVAAPSNWDDPDDPGRGVHSAA